MAEVVEQRTPESARGSKENSGSNVSVAFIGGRGIFSNYGGVENAIREVSAIMAQRGLNVCVYGTQTKENFFNLPSGLYEVSAPGLFYKYLGQHGLIFFCVFHAIFALRPGVVFLFASGPCAFTPILRFFGIKVITSLRAIDSQRNKWGVLSRNILRFGEYCAWRFSSEFTVNSKEMYDYYFLRNNKVKYIPNGASAADSGDDAILENYKIQKNQFYLFAARLDPVKRLELLLKAYKKLPEPLRFPLVVAGGNSKDNSYYQYLRKCADDNVYFIGHVSNEVLDPLMRNCRVFILPSVLEGMSNSLLTAMISRKPVLLANVRANADVVEDFDPVLFEADDEGALLKKLIMLSKDDQHRLNVSNQLYQFAKLNFTWDKTADNFYKLAIKYIDNKPERNQVA